MTYYKPIPLRLVQEPVSFADLVAGPGIAVLPSGEDIRSTIAIPGGEIWFIPADWRFEKYNEGAFEQMKKLIEAMIKGQIQNAAFEGYAEMPVTVGVVGIKPPGSADRTMAGVAIIGDEGIPVLLGVIDQKAGKPLDCITAIQLVAGLDLPEDESPEPEPAAEVVDNETQEVASETVAE